MMTSMKRLAGLAIASALLATSLAGCVIATDSGRSSNGATQAATGANYCDKSSDGLSVACGGRASSCEQSSDGRQVACGGVATYCQKSSDGHEVACGGKADYCEKSSDGRKIACGGGTRSH